MSWVWLEIPSGIHKCIFCGASIESRMVERESIQEQNQVGQDSAGTEGQDQALCQNWYDPDSIAIC